VRTPLRKLLAC